MARFPPRAPLKIEASSLVPTSLSDDIGDDGFDLNIDCVQQTNLAISIP